MNTLPAPKDNVTYLEPSCVYPGPDAPLSVLLARARNAVRAALEAAS